MFGYRVMAKKLEILIFPSLCEKHCIYSLQGRLFVDGVEALISQIPEVYSFVASFLVVPDPHDKSLNNAVQN